MRNLSSVFTAVFFAFLNSACAQQGTMEVGIEGGPSANTFRGYQLLYAYQTNVGYAAGITFQYNFTDHLSLRSGVSWDRKGSGSDITLVDPFGSTIKESKLYWDLDYLTIPLLVRYAFGAKTQFILNGGPYLGYLVQERDRIDRSSGFEGLEIDNTDQYGSIDLGVGGGIGVLIPVHERIRLSAEVRNNLGLVNISAAQLYNDGTIKTNSMVLLVGCMFAIGRSKNEAGE